MKGLEMKLYLEPSQPDKLMKFPAVPPIVCNPKFKIYTCPFCNETIATGHIRALTMVCAFCYNFIKATEEELTETR